MTGPAAGFRRVLEVLNRLHIPYMIGGSLATSIHGIARATLDIDVIADISMESVDALLEELKGEFYVDPAEAIRQALRAGRMFHLIHYASSYKFDLHPLSPGAYYRDAFARRRMEEYSLDGRETLKFHVATPEDAILTKMAWYRAGQEVSERQWSDVLDVVRVQRECLDLTYLRQWAGPLGVRNLPDQALQA